MAATNVVMKADVGITHVHAMEINNLIKKSNFNISFEKDSEHIIYNTLSGSIISLEEDKALNFFNNNFENFSKEEINSLLKMRYIFEDDELEFLKTKSDALKNEGGANLALTIATTTACNARCFYCYEKGIKVNSLAETDIDKIIRFIKERNNNKEIKISWFGGEPLLNSNFITSFCTRLINENIKFHSTMISNGYLLTNIQDKDLKTWNLKNIQITLDSTYKKYNEIKNFIYKGNAFEKVVDGIKLMLKNKINVSIRLNFSKDNLDSILKTIDWIFENFGRNKYLYVYAAPIIAKDVVIPNNNEENIFLKVWEKLAKYNYLKFDKSFNLEQKLLPCARCNRNYFVISPGLKLYKCEHMIGIDNAEVGNLSSGKTIINKEVLDSWENNELPEKCLTCSCLPVCYGGCKAYKDEGITDGDCTQIKKHFEKIVEFYCLHKCFNQLKVKDIRIMSSTKKHISFIKEILKLNSKLLKITNNKKLHMRLPSTISEKLVADYFGLTIKHENGLDAIDKLTDETVEIKCTNSKNYKCKFSTKQADYVCYLYFDEEEISFYRITKEIYNHVDKNGFLDVKKFVSQNNKCCDYFQKYKW